jgi:hypothetical protein
MGMPVEKAANRAAMANVESLGFFIDYAAIRPTLNNLRKIHELTP